ncbi:MAG: hypothetical protein ACYCW6_08550, partial [Candidatus Xenobia bacterium]
LGWLAVGALALAAAVPGVASACEAPPPPPETAVVETTTPQAVATQENLLAQTPVGNFQSQIGPHISDNSTASQMRSGFAQGWQILQNAAQAHQSLPWSDPCQGDASCSELSRSITENGQNITVYLQDAHGFQKGDLVVANSDGSGATWILRGDTMLKQNPTQTIHGFAGDEQVTTQESWQVPRLYNHIYPHTVMTYTKTETRENEVLHTTATHTEKVTLRQDGSTLVRSDDGAPQLQPANRTK